MNLIFIEDVPHADSIVSVLRMSSVSAKSSRGLTAADVAALSLEERRKLVQALALEHGHQLRGTTERGHGVDLIMSSTTLGQERRVLIRINDGGLDPTDIQECVAASAAASCSEFVLVGSTEDHPDVAESGNYLSAEMFVKMVESASLISWAAGVPSIDVDGYLETREKGGTLSLADPTGLRWLRPLSLNKMPTDLVDTAPAEAWFERAVFRIATRALGLRGRRLGSATSGARVPDGYFACTSLDGAVLYDCKAARDGFTMDAAEERKLLEYASGTWGWDGSELAARAVVIFSSGFPSDRSFAGRQKKFAEAGVQLVYFPVDAVSALTMPLLVEDYGSEAARLIDWPSLLSQGMVAPDKASAVAMQALLMARSDAETDRSRTSALMKGQK